jgi:hypothetical protein
MGFNQLPIAYQVTEPEAVQIGHGKQSDLEPLVVDEAHRGDPNLTFGATGRHKAPLVNAIQPAVGTRRVRLFPVVLGHLVERAFCARSGWRLGARHGHHVALATLRGMP